MVVINKCIIQIILTFCFQLKYELSIHNIAFSSKSVISSETGEKNAQIKHHLQAKTVQNPSNKYGGFDADLVDFDVKSVFQWRKYYGLYIIGLYFWPQDTTQLKQLN